MEDEVKIRETEMGNNNSLLEKIKANKNILIIVGLY